MLYPLLPLTMTASTTTPAPMIATLTSWPFPGWIAPALVATVPATLGSLASVFDGEPIWILPGNPAAVQVVTLPGTNEARGSDGAASGICAGNSAAVGAWPATTDGMPNTT